MIIHASTGTIGALLSGGLDSAVLLGHLLRRGHRVRPIYVRSRLIWEPEEFRAMLRYRAAIGPRFADRLLDLVVLEMPVIDVYEDHWSITGCEPPDAETPAEAMYLPGRNPLLLIKPAIWCVKHGIDQLALGILGTNPFPDATNAFFDQFRGALSAAMGARLRFVRPFAHLDKRQVMELGADLPLEHTFSCIAPVGGLHCGQCNKCAERQESFRLVGRIDPTPYAVAAVHQRAA
jgi:7-cyano-7-deazaguanine synthase